MKKKLLVAMILGAAVLTTACGSKKEKTEEAVTEGSENKESEEPSSSEIELNEMSAIVESQDGMKLTVINNDDKEMTFDISAADLNPAYKLMKGDEVEIEYQGSEPNDGMAVTAVIMENPCELEDEEYTQNPSIFGTILSIDDKKVTIKENPDNRELAINSKKAGLKVKEKDTYEFDRASFESDLTDGELAKGQDVLLSYITVGERNVCVSIVSEDKIDEFYEMGCSISGTLEKIDHDVLYVKAGDIELKFAAANNEELLLKAQGLIGKNVKISYDNSLMMRAAYAVDIEEAK